MLKDCYRGNKMKKLLALLLALSFVVVLSACKNDNGKKHKHKSSQSTANKVVENSAIEPTISVHLNNGKVSRNTAIKVALAHANLKKEEVLNLNVEHDIAHGGTCWEVDFEHNGYEYSYDIDIETGNIMSVEKEGD